MSRGVPLTEDWYLLTLHSAFLHSLRRGLVQFSRRVPKPFAQKLIDGPGVSDQAIAPMRGHFRSLSLVTIFHVPSEFPSAIVRRRPVRETNRKVQNDRGKVRPCRAGPPTIRRTRARPRNQNLRPWLTRPAEWR